MVFVIGYLVSLALLDIDFVCLLDFAVRYIVWDDLVRCLFRDDISGFVSCITLQWLCCLITLLDLIDGWVVTVVLLVVGFGCLL